MRGGMSIMRARKWNAVILGGGACVGMIDMVCRVGQSCVLCV